MTKNESKNKTVENHSPPIVPMVSEEGDSLGDIAINNTVVVRIASLAAQQVEGVVGISCGNFVDKVLANKSSGGVRVAEDEHGNYNITLPVTLQFGLGLAEIAYSIQSRVRDQITKMTNKNVARVDVVIEDIKMPEHTNESSKTAIS